MDRPGRASAGAILQAAQRGRRGQRAVPIAGRLHQQIVPQRPVIVQILIALNQPEYALAQHVGKAVRDALGIARIGEHPGHRIDQSKAPIELANER